MLRAEEKMGKRKRNGNSLRSTVCVLACCVAIYRGTTTLRADAFQPGRVSFSKPLQRAHRKLASTISSGSATESNIGKDNSNFKRPDVVSLRSEALAEILLRRIKDRSSQLGREHAEMFGLDESQNDEERIQTSAGMFAILDAIKHTLGIDGGLGLSGYPLVIRKEELERAMAVDGEMSPDSPPIMFDKSFTMKDLEKALDDDFLDASRGSTDNRKGWSISPVSIPKGESFEEARMTYDDVKKALEKGTVIFNAFGAHVPKLAGPCLAATDATDTPNAVNLYVTADGKRTSAPPHTDKQDVLVVQTNGKKHWRVYERTISSLKPSADVFARGKGTDNLPLHVLESMEDNLLLETDLNPGDVLFVPAGLPHTTATAHQDQDENGTDENDKTSVHLTFNIDTHIWELDYLNARRLALRRANVIDTALGQSRDEDNVYVGKVNELPDDIHRGLLTELPLGFLGPESTSESASVDTITTRLKELSQAVDPKTFQAVEDSIWRDTVEELQSKGNELLEIHRDMYLAALEEGRTRKAEDMMTAHLGNQKRVMTPERIQRLSLFRVEKFFKQIDAVKANLLQWSYDGEKSDGASESSAPALPDNWAFVLPVKVGDQVDADLGGAFFSATVTRVLPGGRGYDVQYFDGDRDTGLDRSMIKLLTPPDLSESGSGDDDVDTSQMTPKQLKRWKKAQKKKKMK
mmetsp:Transcript_3786/g.9925  ORF Transcript_3786/g.9925 Transcript_3786/m.9925 type:complete len:692 (+) Transcript_3786:80-2155(+)